MDLSPLDINGNIKPDPHRHARMFHCDLELFEGISGTETFCEVGRGDWRELFEAGDVAGELSLIDAKYSSCGVFVNPFTHSEGGGEASERGVWEEFCVSTDEGRRESLQRAVSEQESVAGSSVAVFFSGWRSRVGGAPLAVVRSHEFLWCRSQMAS